MTQVTPTPTKAVFTVTSRLFKPIDFPGDFTDGCDYLNAGILQQMEAEIKGYFFLGYENQSLRFTAADKTIALLYSTQTENFIQSGWRVGMVGSIVGSASNDMAFTVTAVAERVITIAEALTDEDCQSCSIYDDTPITAMNFQYNLVRNDLGESFLSLTDLGIRQKFSASGLDASDTGTTVNFLASTSSFAWVTNNLTVPATGETDEVTVIGDGISGHKQSFTINQKFKLSPFWLAEQLQNYQGATPPQYFAGDFFLNYIFRVDGKFLSTDPISQYSGGAVATDLTCWLNSNNQKTLPEYWIDSFTLLDGTDNQISGNADINTAQKVQLVVKSRSGVFQNGGSKTKFVVDFVYANLNATQYKGTATTLRQNLMNDSVAIDTSSGPTNGEYFGTDYQVIKDCSVSDFSASQVKIDLTIDFSTFLKAILNNQDDSNLNFLFSITTQNVTITTVQQSDRVTAFTFQTLEHDRDIDNLITPVDWFRVKQYPEKPTENSVKDYEGAPCRASFPFLLSTQDTVISGQPYYAGTLINAGMQVVAVKSGEDDFVLDGKVFGSELATKLLGVQQIDSEETRNFITYEGDPYNIVSLKRDQSFDVGTLKGFVVDYAFVLRYENWKQIIPLAEQYKYDLFQSALNTSDAWKTIQQAGWSLQLKFVASVKDSSGYVTDFSAYAPITIPDDSGISIFTTTAPFSYQIQFFNENGLELKGINIGQKTFIRVTQFGDWSAADFNSWYGYIFADLTTALGGINNRRFASSQYDSEEDSPFIATPPDLLADNSVSSQNLTVNFFEFNVVTLECIFDDTKQRWGIQEDTILFSARCGYPNNNLIRLFNDDTQHNFNDDTELLFNTN